MAESLIIHFASASWDDVARHLDHQAVRSERDYGGLACWAVPNPDDYLVLIYEYPDHLTEFEPEELCRLHKLLGGHPRSAVCLELRRSRGRLAYDLASVLAADLLRQFDGVVEDICGDVYWSLKELEGGAAKRAALQWWPDAEQ